MTDCHSRVVEQRRRLEPRPESAGAARRAVLDALDAAGRADLADAAQLLVSELVTNAIVHARTSIELEVLAGPDGLRVAVRDRSPQLPSHRHYGRSATTGRGLELVEMMSDRHGAEADAHDGKTVWFELGSTLSPEAPAGDGQPGGERADLTVRLGRLPVPLTLAWQQHADALLRELTLAQWDRAGQVGALPADDVAGGDALATVAAALESLGPAGDLPPHVDLELHLRRETVGHFDDLATLLDHASTLAEKGLTLAPPTQPEIRLLRRWICGEIRGQSVGQPPRPWPGLPTELPTGAARSVEWDTTAVRHAEEAVVAADDENRILAASPAALELLGWDDELVGRRIVAVVPEQLREAHIAAFTLHLLTGETRILDREVPVPALRRDGSEVDIRLLVERENAPDGRPVFIATMRRP